MTRRPTFLTAAAMLLSSSILAQVSVKTEIPATVTPGSEFTVKLNVQKGDVSGFAKLEQVLPSGFVATSGIETANATFSFKDQKAKFLWMALPNGDFEVSYSVSVDKAVSGNQIVEGTFSYIKDNDTEKYIIPKDIVMVKSGSGEDAQQAAMDNILAEQQAKEEAEKLAREQASSETTEEEPAEEEAAATEEFAEPVEETYEAPEEVAEEVTEEPAYDEPEAYEEPEPAAAYEEPAQTAAPSYNDAMLKSKPGLVFRVQVAAGPNQVDPNTFKTEFGLMDNVSMEEHEGLYKYIVGEFGSYRPAKTYSNELRDSNGVNGPFVTAYNNGTRIHVQEALEIAGQ